MYYNEIRDISIIYGGGENVILGKIVICLVGMILFTVGFYQLRKRSNFIKNGVETKAEIVDFCFNMDKTWTYIYSFMLPDGQKIILK